MVGTTNDTHLRDMDLGGSTKAVLETGSHELEGFVGHDIAALEKDMLEYETTVCCMKHRISWYTIVDVSPRLDARCEKGKGI